MTKKRQFHCQQCGHACDIYKKGKNHRVLVCPSCGVLATNPTVGDYARAIFPIPVSAYEASKSLLQGGVKGLKEHAKGSGRRLVDTLKIQGAGAAALVAGKELLGTDDDEAAPHAPRERRYRPIQTKDRLTRLLEAERLIR